MVDDPRRVQNDEVGCHIVKVNRPFLGAHVKAHCDTLPEEPLAAVTAAAREWRNPGNMAVELSSVVKRFRLPGIAIMFTEKSVPDPEVPPPLLVPFEPIELDETHPTLEPLCERVYVDDGSAIDRPKPSKGQRLFIRVGLPAVFATVGAIYWFLDVAEPGTLLTNLIAILSLALVLGAAIAIYSWRAGRWFVVPGGVMVRKAIWGYFGPAPSLYTPKNSALVVTRGWGSWDVTICQGYRRFTRSLTDVENAVLLAAWQSPHAPPSLDEILGPG